MMKKILCLNCNSNPAVKDERLGILPCLTCQQKTNVISKQVELTTDSIKEQRKAFKPDIRQPWREGQLSKEYLEEHGTKYIKASEEEVKNAKNVWSDLDYYGN
jgi:hypothetical protein